MAQITAISAAIIAKLSNSTDDHTYDDEESCEEEIQAGKITFYLFVCLFYRSVDYRP